VLYRSEAFEPLTDEAWDEARVADGIRAIVTNAAKGFDAETLWRQGRDSGRPLTVLYGGASGVVWALDALHRRDRAEVALDLAAAAERALALWRETPDFPESAGPRVRTHASLFFGETGPLLVACRLAPSPELADALFARVHANVEDETNQVMDGSPGTMAAARMMLEWTGELRWADVWRASAEALWQRRDGEGLWTFQPFGRALGGAHGAATNVTIILQGGDLFPSERAEELKRATAQAVARYAVLEDGLANWPMVVEKYPNLVGEDGQIRVQWCHGGAGVVTSAAPYLEEELLLAGAELVWRAGPQSLEKGPGICHGTAGNGYAFLKLFERTGDELWLNRARRFAVHALGQAELWRTERGRDRYSLWGGSLGAAIYAADCLDARTTMPIVEPGPQ
jgi:hypothetical protein